MNFQAGSTIGDYQVVAVLGAGGMGEVYKVRNTISDRIEAMKVLLADLAHEPDLADRFLREIKVQASLEHPNLAALHTAVRVENRLLMLMEFVEGITLEQRAKQGPIPAAEGVGYISQVLGALEYAHSHGVVHRDLKPANMMLTAGGLVKLMDFGIAKATSERTLTMTGTTVGSLYYMSPEQIQGTDVDARSDLYAVGVSLYELLTGKRPFDGDSQFAIMSAHLEKTPVPPIEHDPKLPKALNDLILMAVAKDPKLRFQTAGAFRNALGNVMRASAPASAPVAAPVPQPAPQPVSLPLPPVPPAAARPAPQVAPPQAAPPPPLVVAAVKSKRWLWMGAGAVAVAAAAIAVIQFGPWKRTEAAPHQEPPAAMQQVQPAAEPPAAQPVSAPPQEPATVVPQPVANTPALVRPAPVPARQAPSRAEAPTTTPPVQQQPPVSAPPQQAVQPPPTQQAPPPQAPAAPGRAELQKSREQLMMLGTRAAGIRTSLQSMQRSQASGGVNLRGDMQEAASLMNSYMEGATAALNAGDLDSVKSFMEKAERQIEKLEKFLGR
jgi:eukaryotic-like serine/threonine-protein kinase